jgi:hypothetical protein
LVCVSPTRASHGPARGSRRHGRRRTCAGRFGEDYRANLAKRNLTQLTTLIKTRLKRMQYRPGLLDGFLASTGLDLTPFRNPRN